MKRPGTSQRKARPLRSNPEIPMKHSDYVRQARKLITELEKKLSRTATTEERAIELFTRTEWAKTQCVNLVEELEGRRTYKKRGALEVSDPNFFGQFTKDIIDLDVK